MDSDQSVLGDPQNDTAYTLCIYDTLAGTPSFARSLTVLPGSLWRDRDPKGIQYKDTTGASQGVVKVALRTGAAGDNSVERLTVLLRGALGLMLDLDARAEQRVTRATGGALQSATTRGIAWFAIIVPVLSPACFSSRSS